MNIAILTDNNQVVTMTSLDLVDYINSERKNIAELAGAAFPSKGHAALDHADFLKKVSEVLGACAGNFSGTYQVAGPNGGSRSVPNYIFPKREACLMAMSYSYDLQAKVFDKMTALEAKQAAPATLSTMDILTLAMASEKGRLLAIEQRDHAVATKAEIGSRREATAMATASTAVREVAKLKEELGRNTKHATCIAVENATKRKFGKQGWRPLKKWCVANGMGAVSVPDVRYGKAQSWPADAWGNVYGVDLDALFGATDCA